MKDLVADIAIALADYPDEVRVVEVKGMQSSVLELYAAKPDIGKLIGKKGRTAGAIREILSSVSAKEQRNYVLEIIE